ncbi:hypothetical protein Anapl_08885 [Anas platyrhynchos]|uniref:Uncharacterized protein n=1 Tax=Anas platyrhynchos TaxID=8839 RepID=R0KB32_ANAPL|nr:hypothetical protein Anapl_08885 [Anas platyrhynchos]
MQQSEAARFVAQKTETKRFESSSPLSYTARANSLLIFKKAQTSHICIAKRSGYSPEKHQASISTARCSSHQEPLVQQPRFLPLNPEELFQEDGVSPQGVQIGGLHIQRQASHISDKQSALQHPATFCEARDPPAAKPLASTGERQPSAVDSPASLRTAGSNCNAIAPFSSAKKQKKSLSVGECSRFLYLMQGSMHRAPADAELLPQEQACSRGLPRSSRPIALPPPSPGPSTHPKEPRPGTRVLPAPPVAATSEGRKMDEFPGGLKGGKWKTSAFFPAHLMGSSTVRKTTPAETSAISADVSIIIHVGQKDRRGTLLSKKKQAQHKKKGFAFLTFSGTANQIAFTYPPKFAKGKPPREPTKTKHGEGKVTYSFSAIEINPLGKAEPLCPARSRLGHPEDTVQMQQACKASISQPQCPEPFLGSPYQPADPELTKKQPEGSSNASPIKEQRETASRLRHPHQLQEHTTTIDLGHRKELSYSPQATDGQKGPEKKRQKATTRELQRVAELKKVLNSSIMLKNICSPSQLTLICKSHTSSFWCTVQDTSNNVDHMRLALSMATFYNVLTEGLNLVVIHRLHSRRGSETLTLPTYMNQGTDLQQKKTNHTKNNSLLPEEFPEATHQAFDLPQGRQDAGTHSCTCVCKEGGAGQQQHGFTLIYTTGEPEPKSGNILLASDQASCRHAEGLWWFRVTGKLCAGLIQSPNSPRFNLVAFIIRESALHKQSLNREIAFQQADRAQLLSYWKQLCFLLAIVSVGNSSRSMPTTSLANTGSKAAHRNLSPIPGSPQADYNCPEAVTVFSIVKFSVFLAASCILASTNILRNKNSSPGIPLTRPAPGKESNQHPAQLLRVIPARPKFTAPYAASQALGKLSFITAAAKDALLSLLNFLCCKLSRTVTPRVTDCAPSLKMLTSLYERAQAPCVQYRTVLYTRRTTAGSKINYPKLEAQASTFLGSTKCWSVLTSAGKTNRGSETRGKNPECRTEVPLLLPSGSGSPERAGVSLDCVKSDGVFGEGYSIVCSHIQCNLSQSKFVSSQASQEDNVGCGFSTLTCTSTPHGDSCGGIYLMRQSSSLISFREAEAAACAQRWERCEDEAGAEMETSVWRPGAPVEAQPGIPGIPIPPHEIKITGKSEKETVTCALMAHTLDKEECQQGNLNLDPSKKCWQPEVKSSYLETPSLILLRERSGNTVIMDESSSKEEIKLYYKFQKREARAQAATVLALVRMDRQTPDSHCHSQSGDGGARNLAFNTRLGSSLDKRGESQISAVSLEQQALAASGMTAGYNRPLTAPQLRSRMGHPAHRPCTHHQRLSTPREGAMRQGPGLAVTGDIVLWDNRSHRGHRETREVQNNSMLLFPKTHAVCSSEQFCVRHAGSSSSALHPALTRTRSNAGCAMAIGSVRTELLKPKGSFTQPRPGRHLLQGQDRPATATEPSVCFCVVFTGSLAQSEQPYTAISAPSILNTHNKLIGEMGLLQLRSNDPTERRLLEHGVILLSLQNQKFRSQIRAPRVSGRLAFCHTKPELHGSVEGWPFATQSRCGNQDLGCRETMLTPTFTATAT